MEKIINQRLAFLSKIDRYIHLSSIGFSSNQIKQELNVSGMTLKRIRKAAREKLNNTENTEEHILMIRAVQLANYRRALASYNEVSIDKKPSAVRVINQTIKTMEHTMSRLGLLPREINNVKIESSADMDKLRLVLDKIAKDKD